MSLRDRCAQKPPFAAAASSRHTRRAAMRTFRTFAEGGSLADSNGSSAQEAPFANLGTVVALRDVIGPKVTLIAIHYAAVRLHQKQPFVHRAEFFIVGWPCCGPTTPWRPWISNLVVLTELSPRLFRSNSNSVRYGSRSFHCASGKVS